MYEIAQAKSPTERLREMQRSRDWRLASPSSELMNSKLNIPPLDPASEKSVRAPKKLGELKLGSDSCYSRSDNSSDSECPTRQGLALGNKPPARGEVRFLQAGDADQMSSAKLDRLCPRVRNHQNRHTHYDSTSLSSVDTSSSSDLWNVRAMPDVPFTRLNKPISLRRNRKGSILTLTCARTIADL